jgi:hypothetical protein
MSFQVESGSTVEYQQIQIALGDLNTCSKEVSFSLQKCFRYDGYAKQSACGSEEMDSIHVEKAETSMAHTEGDINATLFVSG